MPNPLRAFARLHPLQRVAAVLWVALIAGVAVRVVASPDRSQSVVPIYRAAAERWAAGEDLYAPQPGLDAYRNPPAFAAAFTPLTWLPRPLTGLVWRGIGVAVFLVALGRWVRHGLARPLPPAASGAVFALAVLPTLPSLNNGQVNVLLAGLMLLGAAAAARGRGVAAGPWFAAAAALKVYPASAALLVSLAGPRRILPAFLLGCAAVAALPFLLGEAGYVAESYRSFATSVGADDRTVAPPSRWPRDLFLVLRVWAVVPSPEVYRGIQLGVAVAMAALVGWVARRTGNARVVAPLGLHLGCVWMTVLGPATETHTYTLLGPTAAATVVLAAADRRGLAGRARLALAVLGYALVVSPVVRDMFPNGVPFQLLGPQPVGGLLILAAVVWDAVRLKAPAVVQSEQRMTRVAA